MSEKALLQTWIVDALDALGGSAKIVRVAEHIWGNHEADLRARGDLFYTWQYDMRWAAQQLRDNGTLVRMQGRKGDGTWTINTS